MWFLAAVVLLFTGGVTCSRTECYKQIEEECELITRRPFLRTFEALLTVCKKDYVAVACYLRVYRKCGIGEEDIKFMSGVEQFLRRECNSESEILKALSINRDCQKPVVSMWNCHNRNVSDKKKDQINSIVSILQDRGFNMKSRCVNAVWIRSCRASFLLEQCGRETAIADFQFYHKMDIELSLCPDEMLPEMQELIEEIPLENVDQQGS